jgi:hypothetical protein
MGSWEEVEDLLNKIKEAGKKEWERHEEKNEQDEMKRR